MPSPRDLYQECQDIARTISLHCAKVKFLTNLNANFLQTNTWPTSSTLTGMYLVRVIQ